MMERERGENSGNWKGCTLNGIVLSFTELHILNTVSQGLRAVSFIPSVDK